MDKQQSNQKSTVPTAQQKANAAAAAKKTAEKVAELEAKGEMPKPNN